jgi:hypothetical protein
VKRYGRCACHHTVRKRAPAQCYSDELSPSHAVILHWRTRLRLQEHHTKQNSIQRSQTAERAVPNLCCSASHWSEVLLGSIQGNFRLRSADFRMSSSSPSQPVIRFQFIMTWDANLVPSHLFVFLWSGGVKKPVSYGLQHSFVHVLSDKDMS